MKEKVNLINKQKVFAPPPKILQNLVHCLQSSQACPTNSSTESPVIHHPLTFSRHCSQVQLRANKSWWEPWVLAWVIDIRIKPLMTSLIMEAALSRMTRIAALIRIRMNHMSIWMTSLNVMTSFSSHWRCCKTQMSSETKWGYHLLQTGANGYGQFFVEDVLLDGGKVPNPAWTSDVKFNFRKAGRDGFKLFWCWVSTVRVQLTTPPSPAPPSVALRSTEVSQPKPQHNWRPPGLE